MADNEQFPLADLIRSLGNEIREAEERARADGQADLLELKECEVEVAVQFEKKGDAGVEFWVVKLGGELTKANTQTIKLTLAPTRPTTVDLAG
jgi:hypothetical protein